MKTLNLPSVLFIALRFVSKRKRGLFLSVVGVMFGVAFFICTQAQTQGFEKYFIQSVLDTNGAIVVTDKFQKRYTAFEETSSALLAGQQSRKYEEGVAEPYLIMRVLRSFSNVLAAAPVLYGNVSGTSNFQTEIFNLEGIDLPYHVEATALRRQIIAGNLDEFERRPNAILLGSLLAEKLQATVGNNLVLMTKGDSTSVYVAGIFRSGIDMIDTSRAYVHIQLAQVLFKKPSMASMILVHLRDPHRAPQLAAHLEELLQHRARSWQERERGNLQIFFTLRISAAITVALIILLAGFGIFNVLTLIVLDKVREIAILRSMGYKREQISMIFLCQGVIIAAVGSLAGSVLGAAMTYAVSLIPLRLRGLLYADHFIVHWNWQHYFYATAIAFAAALLASYFPARRASRMEPVDILRGSPQ